MWSLPPHQLVVEVTERELITDEAAMETLDQLRATGVEIAIDGFGAGASSLGYSWALPVSVLRPDRRLANSMAIDPTARRIVSGLMQMADDGCSSVQGYLLHRPHPFSANSATSLRRTR